MLDLLYTLAIGIMAGLACTAFVIGFFWLAGKVSRERE